MNVKNITDTSKQRLSKVFTLIAVLLYILTIAQLISSNKEIGDYGLIEVLPISFYFAIVVLFGASLFIFNIKKSGILFVIQILILVIILYITPYIHEQTPRFPSNYQYMGYTEYILRNGVIDPKVIWYHSWPGFPLLFSCLFIICNISNYLITLALFPVFINLLWLILFFIVLTTSHKIPQKIVYMALWIFCLVNWIEQTYFTAQAISYALMLCTFILTNRYIISNINKSIYIILTIIIIASITITHLLTSLVVLVIFIAFAIALFILKKERNINLPLLIAVFITSWAIYGSIYQLHVNLPNFLSEAFNFEILFSYYFNRALTTTTAHNVVNLIRVSYTFIILLLSAISIFIICKKKHISNENVFFLILFICPLLLIPLIGQRFETFQRIYFFTMPAIAYFVSLLLNRKYFVTFISVIILLSIPLHIINRYGNELVEQVPYTQLETGNFLYDNTTSGQIVGPMPPANYLYMGKYPSIVLSLISNEKDPIKYVVEQKQTNSKQYVIINKNIETIFLFMSGSNYKFSIFKNQIDHSDNYNLIYNSDMLRWNNKIFVWE